MKSVSEDVPTTVKNGLGRRVGRRVGCQGRPRGGSLGGSPWRVRRSGRQGGSLATPGNKQTHKQTNTHTIKPPEPKPIPQRTQGLKYTVRAPPQSLIYIYIYIYIFITHIENRPR